MTISRVGSWLAMLATLSGGEPEVSRETSATTERAVVLQHLTRARQMLGQMRIRYVFPLKGHESRDGYIRQTFWFDHDTGLAFDSSHGERGIESDRWTERQKTIVVADGWLASWPNKRTYAWSREESPTVPADVRHSPIFRAIGLWPLRERYDCGGFDGAPFDLEDVVADPRYQLSKNADGRLVIERPNLDRCVLDNNRGYALLERIWFDSAGAESMRVTMPKLRDMGGGLWLPEEFHIDTMVHENGVGTSERLIGRLESAGPEGKVGFEFSPPPGAMLLDYQTTALTQVVPGGEGYLEDQAALVRAFLENQQAQTYSSHWLSNAWLWGLAAFGVALVFGRKVYRRKPS